MNLNIISYYIYPINFWIERKILFRNISELSYELLCIDNKICLLPIWHYITKPHGYYTFLELQQTTSDSGKIMYQQCVIHWQPRGQILNKLAKSNNSYSAFVSGFLSDVIHKELKLKCFGFTSQNHCNYFLLWQI